MFICVKDESYKLLDVLGILNPDFYSKETLIIVDEENIEDIDESFLVLGKTEERAIKFALSYKGIKRIILLQDSFTIEELEKFSKVDKDIFVPVESVKNYISLTKHVSCPLVDIDLLITK